MMMIDLQSEDVVTLTRAAKLLPKNDRDKPVHVSTLYRWATRGVGSGGQKVRLETLRLGGVRVTSREALQRFAERVTALEDGDEYPSTESLNTSRRAEKAEAELDAAGI
jgi:hypothetical protein